MRRIAFDAIAVVGTTIMMASADPIAPSLPKDTLPASIDLVTIPEGLQPERPVPKQNPLTEAKVRLGRRLFFDPILSGNHSVSCATCHRPDHGFASRQPVAIGIEGKRGTRNALSLFNVTYGSSFFWDGRAATLEAQSLHPIDSDSELGGGVQNVVKRLQADHSYRAQFTAAFAQGVTAKNLAKAIASFERTLLLGNSPVDRFRGGDAAALMSIQRQGLWLFESRGGCWRCHSGSNFTDEKFHNTGVSWAGAVLDPGRQRVTKCDTDLGAFKTPTLRGVALTAPYMHDGSLKSLEDVVRFYDRGGVRNPYLDVNLKPLTLSEDDIKKLVAFLQALSVDVTKQVRDSTIKHK